MTHHAHKQLLAGTLGILVILGVLYATHQLLQHTNIEASIAQFGVLGMVLVGIIAGFNVFIPIHAATLTPAFLAAGFSMHSIVLSLAVGTTIADLIAFMLGVWGKSITADTYPRFLDRLHTFGTTHARFAPLGILLYAAFVPFPNEVILIPLGLMGFSYTKILLPLIVGNILNQALFAFGFAELFKVLF